MRSLLAARRELVIDARTVAAVGLAAVGVCAANPSPGSASAPSRTQIVIYTPFTIDGTLVPSIKILRTASGSCWVGSLAADRSDAWRCFIGNSIIDPCYSGPTSWVVCPSGKGVIRINLTKPLPRNHANPPLNTNTSDPFEIELRGGLSCGLSTGATGTIAGLRLNYGCSNGAWLLGSPNRGTPLWHILYLPSLSASHATSVPILAARW